MPIYNFEMSTEQQLQDAERLRVVARQGQILTMTRRLIETRDELERTSDAVDDLHQRVYTRHGDTSRIRHLDNIMKRIAALSGLITGYETRLAELI